VSYAALLKTQFFGRVQVRHATALPVAQTERPNVSLGNQGTNSRNNNRSATEYRPYTSDESLVAHRQAAGTTPKLVAGRLFRRVNLHGAEI
jgi:hypothetical protein